MATKRESVRVYYEGMSVDTEEPVRTATRQEAQQLKQNGKGYFSCHGRVFTLTQVPLDVIAARFR
jgi:hypothetical protein